MTATIPYGTLTDPIDREEIMANFRALAAKLGALDTSDLTASAGITVAQMASPYQDAFVHLEVRAEALASGWPGSGILAAAPYPGISTNEAWKAVAVHWACTDTGGGTGAFNVKLGTFVSGNFVSATTIASSVLISNGAAANDSNSGAEFTKTYANGTGLSFAADPRSIVIQGSSADASTLTAQGSFVHVCVTLRRAVQES